MAETIQDKFGTKTPWVLGKSVRVPRISFPDFKGKTMSLPAPSRNLLLLGIYAFLFWLVAGGIYIIIEDPIALGTDQNQQTLWLYPSTHDAFIIESIVAAAIIFIGGFGFILLYSATKHAFDYSYAIKIFVLGLMLSIISFVILQYMIDAKGG